MVFYNCFLSTAYGVEFLGTVTAESEDIAYCVAAYQFNVDSQDVEVYYV